MGVRLWCGWTLANVANRCGAESESELRGLMEPRLAKGRSGEKYT